ncbi:hypothetical protein GLN32_09795, partial [Shigella flexneri 2a]|nr:hypothetical protein [Shigella flexneri 2a]
MSWVIRLLKRQWVNSDILVNVALFQFGAGTEFWSCFAVYLIIQALDGNLLVPVLFSEAVNLH